MLRWLIAASPAARPIVVREHPLYLNRYGQELYAQLAHGSQAFIDNTTDLKRQLAECAYVATANSTLGFEALLAGKPVLLFGSAYYQNCHGVLRAAELGDGATLESRLAALLAEPARITAAAREFLERNFIAGHFRHYDRTQLATIAARVRELARPASGFASVRP
jgi:capsule polysaccharide modification protein KpsS